MVIAMGRPATTRMTIALADDDDDDQTRANQSRPEQTRADIGKVFFLKFEKKNLIE